MKDRAALMSGVIYFKFRGTLQHEQLLFDGHFITVGEVKRLIAEKKGLGREGAAELILSDAGGLVEYQDSQQQLPKSSKVTVRRAPPKTKPLVGATPLPVAPAPAAKEGEQEDEEVFGGDVFEDAAAQAAALDAEVREWERERRRGTERYGRLPWMLRKVWGEDGCVLSRSFLGMCLFEDVPPPPTSTKIYLLPPPPPPPIPPQHAHTHAH